MVSAVVASTWLVGWCYLVRRTAKHSQSTLPLVKCSKCVLVMRKKDKCGWTGYEPARSCTMKLWRTIIRPSLSENKDLPHLQAQGKSFVLSATIIPDYPRSHISNGEPSEQLQTLSLSVLDAFGSVHDILNKVDQKHQSIADTIEAFPAAKPSDQEASAGKDKTKAMKATCHNDQLLLLKATSQATLKCMEGALSILQELRGAQLAPPVVVHQTIPVPTAFSQSSANLIPASPHRNLSSLSTPSTPARHSRPKSADSGKTMQ